MNSSKHTPPRYRVAVPWLAAAVACAAIGCTRTAVRTQWDPEARFEGFKTFNWVPRPPADNPAAELAPDFRAQVRTAIKDRLKLLGIRKIKSGEKPDLRVAFYVHFRSDVWVSNHGYRAAPWGVDSWGYRYDPWLDQWTPATAREYDVGTIVIDVIDARRKRVIWRGWGRRIVNPAAPEQAIYNAVNKVIHRFPPR